METGTTANRLEAGLEKLSKLFDAGTFVETGAYVKRGSDAKEFEGIVCGYGSVGGKLVFAFAQDSNHLKGAIDEAQAIKVENLYALAKKSGAPVVGIFDSAGAVVSDGASAMSAYGRILKCVSDASGILPQYAVIDGVCAGTAAVIAALFDFVVTIKGKAELYVNPSFLTGSKTSATAIGLSAIEAKSAKAAYDAVRKLVALLPSNNIEGALCAEPEDLNRKVEVNAGDAAATLTAIADADSFCPLYEGYADEMLTGFASFGGITAGVIATVADKTGGALTIAAARKAAKLVTFCDSFRIPLLTLVNSTGLVCSAEVENAAYASELARLAGAYAAADMPMVTVITGKAYGASFALLGSKALGADLTFALPDAVVSMMAPESAVAFLWNDQVSETVTRASLEEKWVKECASAQAAAAKGAIDDVIDPAELRQRICAGFSMLLNKADSLIDRKHATLPL